MNTPADDTPTIQLWAARQQFAAISALGVEPAPGSVLRSRYVLEEVIGRGGTSVIYRATDLQRAAPDAIAANRVAIKLLRTERRADPLALVHLKREFRQMQGLSHPGIAQVFDLNCDAEVWFMSLELVAGRTVNAWMQAPGRHTDALGIITACCEALEHAHSLGILHGDLKPTNVMLADDGAVKLIDFGSVPSPVSRGAAASDPTVGTTPLYASPQVLAGMGAECSDDVFSLACLSYSILSGGLHPFGGRPSLEDGRAKSAPTYVRAIPRALFEVIERALSAERERRPASVTQFRHLLTAANAVSRTTLPTPFKGRTHAPGAALVAFDRIGAGLIPDRHSQPFVRLMGLMLAIAGAAAFLRLDTRPDLIAPAELPSAAMAASSNLLATVLPQAEAALQSRPLVHDSGVISFEGPTLHASAVQSLVAISVKRLQATTGSAAFAWRVERGTAQPGIDYERIPPQVVRFIEGQAVRTLFIPLINTPATSVSRDARTFTVALERVAGGPALGRFARVTVAIDPPATLSRVAACCSTAEKF
ncbi:MAG TPA: protein kinase [Steroidobacteraceae bacterium]|nr:protein kinase [Steroidobacteraceae bacterium]